MWNLRNAVDQFLLERGANVEEKDVHGNTV
jgi:hypothetical protein